MKTLQDISIQYVKGVGPARKKLFKNLGIETIEDLFYFFPRRYEDRTQMTPISKLKVGEWQTVKGTILARGSRKSWYTKKHVYEASIDDGHGRLVCVWFNQPYLDKYLKVNHEMVVYGKVDVYKSRTQMVSPEYEVISKEDEQLSVGRIVPVYPLTRGMTQRYLRKVVNFALGRYASQLKETLPYSLRTKYSLENIIKSIHSIHFPETLEIQNIALKRISFEEFFMFQASVILRRLSITAKAGFAHHADDGLIADFAGSFPFTLTGAQKKVIEEIASDMNENFPMLRLLQGDVGCGKTVVAFFGCVAAYKNHSQAAVMAPTEILARQHYEVLKKMIAGGPFKKMRIALLTSNLKKQEKAALYKETAQGKIDLLIGTHALIEEDVKFKKLSFAVIDEQHKFGVRQRALLTAKGGNPDVLIMTATPIPRTLCLTLYGDLDVSVIDEMPANRGKVRTQHFNEERAQDAYKIVREMVQNGQQAYIVYPIIEESKKLDLKAATAMFNHFKKNEFKDCRLALVHGQLDQDESKQIMEQFKNHELDILVATSVLEVGIDVADANVMVIEHADRFGLAQLHQLRGRIGRGRSDALCILIADMATAAAQARIKAVLSTNDGFKIAQQDLMIRGPGQFFGRHQHGLNELKFSDPTTQLNILEMARKEALEVLKSDPGLKAHENMVIKETIQQRYPTYLAMVEAG